MSSTAVADTSSDFIAFSDSDVSPVITPNKPRFYTNQHRSKNFGYKNQNEPRNWNAKYQNTPNKAKQNTWYRNNHNRYNNKHQQGNYSKNKYVHPSFLEDPWAILIRQQNKSNEEEIVSNTSNSNNIEFKEDV